MINDKYKLDQRQPDKVTIQLGTAKFIDQGHPEYKLDQRQPVQSNHSGTAKLIGQGHPEYKLDQRQPETK